MRLYEVTFDGWFIFDGKVSKDANVVSLHQIMDITDIPVNFLRNVSNCGYTFSTKHIFIIDIDFRLNMIKEFKNVYEYIFNKVIPIIRYEQISKIVDE